MVARVGIFLVCLIYSYSGALAATDIKGLLSRARKGDGYSQYLLGYYYEVGKGIGKDQARAFYWYHRAAMTGNKQGQRAVGWCYQKGVGTKKNLAEAFKWYRRSAEAGYSIAQNDLGYFYLEGYGVEKNPAMAVKWFTKSAKQGNEYAWYNLGYCLNYGFGVPVDLERALACYKQAAEKGHESAKKKVKTLSAELAAAKEKAESEAKKSAAEPAAAEGDGAREKAIARAGAASGSFRDREENGASSSAFASDRSDVRAVDGDDGRTRLIENPAWFGGPEAEKLVQRARRLRDKGDPASLLAARDLLVKAMNMGHPLAMYELDVLTPLIWAAFPDSVEKDNGFLYH